MQQCNLFDRDLHFYYFKEKNMIKSRDGSCLAYESGRRGADVWLMPCESGAEEQSWKYDKDRKLIKSKDSKLCLAALEHGVAGAELELRKCDESEERMSWKLKRAPNV